MDRLLKAIFVMLALLAGTAVAAPAYQGAGTAQNGTGAVSPAWPTHAVGDIALLFVESTGGEAVTLSAAAGFAAVTGSAQDTGSVTNATRLTVFWARATSTNMATPTVADPGNHVYARIFTYRGVVGSGNPWDATGGGVKATTSTSLTVTSVTTTVPDTLVVQAAAHGLDNTGQQFSNQTNANLPSITERADAGTTSGNGGGFAVWDGVRAAAGATGNTSVTVTSSVNAFLTIALRAPLRACVSVATGNWSAANTWNCGAGPGDGPPAANDSVTINNHVVSLDTSASAASLTINSGTLRQTGNVVRSLGISGNVTNSGTVTDNGTNGSFDLTVGGNLTVNGTSFTVDNLTVAGNTTSGITFTVRTDFNVGGDLTNNSAAFTVNNLIFQRAGTQAATFYGTLSSVTNFTVNVGSTVSSANYSTLNLLGSLTNNGAISLPNTSWLINGTAAQSIGGTVDTSFGNLIMNNAAGLTLSRNVTVPGTLTLTNGDITTGVFTLSAGANCPGAISGGSAASYVNGYLQLTYPGWSVTCVYPVGSATAYAPITVAIPYFAGISGGTLTGSTANGEHPQISSSGINPAQDVNRYWTLGAVGDTMSTLPSGGSYIVNLGFVAGDVDGGATVSTFQVGMRGATTWSPLAGSASGTTAIYPGQAIFGSYAVGSVQPPVVMLGKTAGASAGVVGTNVTFNLLANNPTAAALTNVVLTDVIPTGMTYITSAPTLGTTTLAGQTLTWTIPYLPAGGSAQLTLSVQPTVRGSYTNTVQSLGAADASATILILPSAITRYSMDEDVGSWTGATGEVIDSGGTNLPGRRQTTALPTTTNAVVPSPTIASEHPSVVDDFCNAGSFDGKAVVVSTTGDYFHFGQRLSASAWIYPTARPTSDLYSILSNDTNYEFHLDTGRHLYWWWNYDTLTSAATIDLNKWTHIAITMDSSLGTNSRQRIYINGVADTNTNNWSGTLDTNYCPFYIGGDITTGAACALIPGRNFHGKIDEVKIYNYELSAAEVHADMTLGRVCGTSSFDHIQIEHDGTASTCAPKTVTVKACMNASCSSLYSDPVTVHLSPSGWTPSDVVTITGGVTTVTLNNSAISEPSLTLGTTSVSPSPAGATRCFNGATETCTLAVGSTSCLFDAAEVGANPQTHLYTKLAGTAFNLDVLAVGTPATTVDITKNTTVSVDLVDTSSAACSASSTALNAAQPVTLASGRRTVSMTCSTVASSAQVRIRTGSAPSYTYACSYDKFAVRPSAAILTSTNTLATPPSPSDANTIRAAAPFNLGATTAPTGYAGVLTLESGALTAQNPNNGSTQESGGVIGALALTPFTVNTVTYNSAIRANTAQADNATYSEVGYFYANAGAFRDTGFTSVDQINQLANCVATDTCDCLLSTSATNGSVPNNLSDVLINGRYGCYVGNKTGFGFGRFVPDHFHTTITAASVLPCPTGLTCPCPPHAVCPPSLTRFVYSGMEFTANVFASNATNQTTRNYVGAFAHDLTLSAVDAATGGVPSAVGSITSGSAVAAAAFVSGTTGAGTQPTPVYTFTDPQTVPTDIYMRAVETGADGVTSADSTWEQGIKVVSGRLKVSNAYGSELLPLTLYATAQYYTAAGWMNSTTDSLTGLNIAASYAVGTGTSTTTLTPATGILNNGVLDILMAPPGITGAATVLPMVVGCAVPATCYLPVTQGTATFGVYKGNNRFIYRREN